MSKETIRQIRQHLLEIKRLARSSYFFTYVIGIALAALDEEEDADR